MGVSPHAAGPGTTRTVALMDEIRRRLASRSLTAGEKLPSVRAFARTMGVSPSTVVEAYDRLAAEGLIRSRPGSGFYAVGAAPPLVLTESAPRLDRAIDPLWVSRQSLDAHPDTLRPGCGWLPADWMPNAAVRRALRKLARADDAVLSDYGGTRGLPPLRQHLARQFAAEGIAAGADQVLLTGSGTQALDLLCRFFLQPGDTVLLDDPCYFNFQALLRAHRVRIVSVPQTPSGPDPVAFAAVLAAHRPRLYVTNSAIHNPTGATLSPQIAHRILTMAAAHEMAVIEDDIFADFEPDPSTRLAALDGLDRVIRIGSFSKTLSASLRCGYIAARREWIEGLVDLQVATNFGSASPATASIIHAALSDGGYRKHMTELRTRLARRQTQAIAALGTLGIEPWTLPRGGFLLWCRLPDGLDAAQIARDALNDGVLLAPGDVFSVARTAPDMMRFNVAQMAPAVIAVLKGSLDRGSRSGDHHRLVPAERHSDVPPRPMTGF